MEELKDSEPADKKELGFEELRNAFYLGRDRASLFLTAKGVKPASILEIWIPVGQKEDVQHEYEENIESCKGILNNLGLFYTQEHEIDEDDGVTLTCERHLFMVGKDKKNLDALLAAEKADFFDYATYGRNLGKALGYPPTAIEADATHSAMKPDEYPPEIFKDPAWPFCIFALSKDHWKEEMEFVREQAEFIKKEDPRLYYDILSTRYVGIDEEESQ